MEGNGRKRYSVAEAAQLLGITERGVRWKLNQGQLEGIQEQKRWWVFLPEVGEEEIAGSEEGRKEDGSRRDEEVPEGVGSPADALPEGEGSTAVRELVQLVRELQQQNLELAGQLGYTQRRLIETEEQMRLLQAPPQEEVLPVAEEGASEVPPIERHESAKDTPGWWRRVLDGFYGRS